MRSRLGQPSSTSSSSSTPPHLDGASSTAKKLQSIGQQHSGRVADRIRAINGMIHNQSPNVPPAQDTKWVSRPPVTQHEITSEASIKQRSPFNRRDASQSPIYSTNPTEPSRMPVMSPYYHCPVPKRVRPRLSTDIEKGATEIIDSGNAPDHKKFVQSTCSRHGRKLNRVKNSSVAGVGLERGFGGMYIPTGRKIRCQGDAASPWTVAWKPLTKTEGTTVSPEICPDCLAEQDILERELDSIHNPTASYGEPSSITKLCSSTETERGTPVLQSHPNVLVGTSHDNQAVNIPGTTTSGLPLDQFSSIVAADLGDMIDAIIIEHSGTLDKVITNLRNGQLDAQSTHKLCSDLTKVSDAISLLPEHDIQHAKTFDQSLESPLKHAMVFDTSQERFGKRVKTMPELLKLIDATAEHFSLSNVDSDGELMKVSSSTGNKLPRIPGGFPPTNPATPFHTISKPSTVPTESLESLPSLPLAQMDNPSPGPEAPPGSDPSSRNIPPTKGAPLDPQISDKPLPREPSPTTSQRPSQLPKAVAQPDYKYFSPASGQASRPYRATPTKPKPSDVAKQQKEQRTFQQAWLKEAASAERLNRRSRSRLRA